MNNTEYHRAGKMVLNWKRLPIPMKARYGHWSSLSNCSWTINFQVRVLYSGGRKIRQDKQPLYPFETRKGAEECVQWWKDNNCLAVIEEVENNGTG